MPNQQIIVKCLYDCLKDNREDYYKIIYAIIVTYAQLKSAVLTILILDCYLFCVS